MKTKKTEFYRVITPSTFSNQSGFKSLGEAKEFIIGWGTHTRGSKESRKYWREQAELCYIEKVKQEVEIIEYRLTDEL